MLCVPGTTWSWLQVQYPLNFLKFYWVHLNKQTKTPNGTLTSSCEKFTKHLFRLPINLYIQTKHHPVAVSKWGGEERIQNQCIFTNRLQGFTGDTFYCKFWWQSHGYGFCLLFHNSKMSYSSSIIFDHNFDLSADHCHPCSTHCQTTTLAWSWALDP